MAKLKANDVGLFLNTGTTAVPVWKVLACLTATDIDLAVEELNGDSKCGIDREAGDVTWTGSFEGFFKLDPTSTEVSGENLLEIAQAKTKKEWKISNSDDSYYRAFTAYISSYNESAPYNEFVTFSGELNVSGTVATAPTP
ncbi:phage tail tube protein [Chitinophaga rhizosphaerae]|uniref:phage tail tube protein n=1 Tax=Chitinophaga rhizosphaerae TaxID=1864947 RepID=UPI000F80797F|nr:phage tail tube protein [Chitinophaga rhizosphaerae]